MTPDLPAEPRLASPARLPWWSFLLAAALGALLVLGVLGVREHLAPAEADETASLEAEAAAHESVRRGDFAGAIGHALAAHGGAASPTRRALMAEVVADLAAEAGDVAAAVAWLEEAERIAREEEGLQPIEATMYLAKKSEVLRAAGRGEEALGVEEEIRARYREGASEAAARVRRGDSARALAGMGRWQEAEEAVTGALAALEELAGPGSAGALELLARRAVARARLGRVDEARGDLDAAEGIARGDEALGGLPLLAAAEAIVAGAAGEAEASARAWDEALARLGDLWDHERRSREAGAGWLGQLTGHRAAARWTTAELVDLAGAGAPREALAGSSPPRAQAGVPLP